MRKIALYTRVSTKEAAKRKEGSIKAQIERLQMRVDDKNKYNDGKWGRIIDIYKDEARSGKDTNRPEYQRMIGDMAAGKIDTVMVTELSRINRSVVDFLAFMNICKEHGTDFVCLQYDFDTTTSMGKMLVTIMAALYQFEREQTIERIKNNYWVRSLRGLLNGGSPILGYDRDPNNTGSRVLNPTEAETVKLLFGLYDTEHRTLGEVIRIAGQRGICNKSWVTKEGNLRGGNPFNRTSLYNLLTNPSYLSRKEINAENKDKKQEELKEEERYQLVPAPWQPIISQEQFDRVQAKLEKNREGIRARENRNYDFFLTGILHCDECGRPLVGETGHGANQDHYYYSHSPSKKSECRIMRYSAPKIEALIREEMAKLLNDSETVEAFVNKIQNTMESGVLQIDSRLAQLKREIEETENKKRNLINIISAHSDASLVKGLIDELKRLELQVENLGEKREELKIQRIRRTSNQADQEYVLKAIQQFVTKGFDRVDLSKKRTVIRELFKTIHIHPDNVIRLNIWSSKPVTQIKDKKAAQVNEGATAMNDETTPCFVQQGVVIPFPLVYDQTSHVLDQKETPSWEEGVVCSSIVKLGRGGGI